MKIVIRNERESDFTAVKELTREAFWNLNSPGCNEHYLVHVLRNHPDFIIEMDYVAEVDNKIVGNIVYTKSRVIDEREIEIETLTFGPVSVLPDYQRRGIGTALINFTKEIAVKNNAKAIIILGHPHFYCKLGFRNSIDFMVSNSEGRYPYGQLMLELEKGFFKDTKWKFLYSPVYNFDSRAADEFDKQFSLKTKEFRPTQEEFSIAVRAYLS
jgi:putative acetyltransferase